MKKYYIYTAEITLWLIAAALGVFFFIYKPNSEYSAKNTYYVYFDDAAGLEKGSPVRFSGIDAGYVKNIKIIGNKVLIAIQTKKGGVKLPKRASASIEFYGLGGSASMELKPLSADAAQDAGGIIPFGSYRVQDYWNGQKLSSETMIDTYGKLGRNIDNSGILNNKQLLFQSAAVQDFIEKTQKINHSQTVIINKMHSAFDK